MANVVSEKLEEFVSHGKPIEYRTGEVVVHADENPEYVYFIDKGYVRIYSIFEDGKEFTIDIIGRGNFFSSIWLIADIPNRYYFETVTPAKLIRVDKEALLEFFKKSPEVLFATIKSVVSNYYLQETRFTCLLSGQAYHKVIFSLLFSARSFCTCADQKKAVIGMPLTHQLIASFSGLARETVSLEMKKLEEKKLIKYNKKFLMLNDLPALRRECLVDIG